MPHTCRQSRSPPSPIRAHRPRIEEQQFDVEHQEQDRDQVELDVELLPGVADRVHARFVGHLLDRRRLSRLEREADASPRLLRVRRATTTTA